jgi:hypothetical protein
MGEPVERLNADASRLGITDKVRVLAEGETMLLARNGAVLPSRPAAAERESSSPVAASYGHG